MDPSSNSPNFNSAEDENIDIKRYLSLFLTNWYWFVIALIIALTVAYAINRYSQKIYTVSATMLIKDEKSGGAGIASSIIPGGNMFSSQMSLNNEMGIIKSLSLNYRVMKELNDFHVVYTGVGRRKVVESRLYKSCPFIVVYDSIELEPKWTKVGVEILSKEKYRIKIDGDLNFESDMNFGERFTKYGFDFIIEWRNPGGPGSVDNILKDYYFYFADQESLANEYKSKLSVFPIVKDASIVMLSVSGPVLEQEADYLNKLMDVYMRYGLDNKNQTADSTIKFIDVQLGILADSLRLAEDNLENFRQGNRIMDLSSEGSLIRSRIEKLETEKSGFEMQLQYFNYLSDYLNTRNTSGTIISPSVMGITDQIALRLIGEFSGYQKDIERMGLNIGDNQPAPALLYKQLEDTREALKENVRNNIDGLKLLSAESDRKISEVEIEINRLPATERKFINIQRRFDLNNTVYTYLLEKRSESGIAKASNIPDNRVVDKASPFSAALIKPRTRKNYMTAIILGLLAPMGMIVLLDFFNDKVIDKKDIERKTKLPVIGYIGHNEGISEMPVVEKPGSALAESFRAVRTALKYFVKENEVAVISVSSTISSEGKTFVSVNLAAIVAMLGKKVLLIGLDLRKPRMNRIFESNHDTGMSNYLSGNSAYEDIIRETQVKNLFFAPSGPRPPNPAELIETEEMKKFLERAKKEFDYIIIDTPPVGLVTDALLLAPYVDANLFIVRQRFTSRNSLEMMEQLHQQGELRGMAIIMNDISVSGYYGYGMRYNYSYGYGYYYGHAYYGSKYYGGYGDGKRGSHKGKGYYTEE
jgi:tyrosine-protein kinase Etk/Wzc